MVYYKFQKAMKSMRIQNLTLSDGNFIINIMSMTKCGKINLLLFHDFFVVCSLKKSSRNTIRMSNSMDPDPTRRFVGSDLGPNCL